MTDVVAFNRILKDFFPRPGERIKQYVIDMRREADWERDTCPRLDVVEHIDNTGASCRNIGRAPWIYLEGHDCCSICNDIAERQLKQFPPVRVWVDERAKRPPICIDRDALSDEIAPDLNILASAFHRRT